MLGLVMMVIFRVITPSQVYSAVNWDTIVLLFGMMIIVSHLGEAGFFEIITVKVDRLNLNIKRTLFILVFGTGILAGFLVNDIACIFFTPVVILMIQQKKYPPLPFLIGLATSTNIGGILTFTGTPQNMIIGNLSGMSFSRYFLLMLPICLVCLLINYLIIVILYRKSISNYSVSYVDFQKERENSGSNKFLKRSLTVLFLVISSFFILGNISWSAFAGAVLLLLLANRDEIEILRRLDWNLLLFFACLFAVVGALRISGLTDKVLNVFMKHYSHNLAGLWGFGLISVIGSNIFANVPYVLVVSESIGKMPSNEVLWFILAFSSTIAGNLTIIGAVANVIVVEKSRDTCHIKFSDFIKFGIPSSLLCFLAGMLIITFYHIGGVF